MKRRNNFMRIQNQTFINGAALLSFACLLSACGDKNVAGKRPKSASGTLSREAAQTFLKQHAPQALSQSGASNLDGSQTNGLSQNAKHTSTQSFTRALRAVNSELRLADEDDDFTVPSQPSSPSQPLPSRPSPSQPSPSQPSSPSQAPSSGPSADPASECVKTSGDQTDADHDGLAVKATTTFSCNQSQEGAKIEMSGSIDTQDKDDANAEGGFLLKMNDVKINIEGSGMKMKLALKGGSEMTVKDGAYVGTTDLEMTMNSAIFSQMASAVSTPTNGRAAPAPRTPSAQPAQPAPQPSPQSVDQEITLGYFFDMKMTPDAGKGKDSGTLDSLNGFFKVKANEMDVVLGVEGKGLTYSSNCGGSDGSFKDGTVTFTDGSGNKAEVVYANCKESYKYNGEALAMQ
jgi:hypothetical protein